MSNPLGFIQEIDVNEINSLANTTNSDLVVYSYDKKVINDYSWLNIVEEVLPYLDAIVHNPRRFLIQEEDVIPVEKTKKVSRESIKHLTQHTNFIQDVDEDGMVYPEKLLNVYKEETFDLYENRFIFTLVKRLYDFFDSQRDKKDRSFNKSKKTIKYLGDCKKGKENLKIELNMEVDNYEVLDESLNMNKVAEQKAFIEETLEDFMSTAFMRTMSQAALVTSPIRKTNVILKDQNFQKALELWDYLNKIEDEPLDFSEEKNDEIRNIDLKKDLDITSLINYHQLNSRLSGIINPQLRKTKEDFERYLEDYLYNNPVDEKEFMKSITQLLKNTTKRKLKTMKEIKMLYNRFMRDTENRIKKAVLLLNK